MSWENSKDYVNPGRMQGFTEMISNFPKFTQLLESGYINTEHPFSIFYEMRLGNVP